MPISASKVSDLVIAPPPPPQLMTMTATDDIIRARPPAARTSQYRASMHAENNNINNGKIYQARNEKLNKAKAISPLTVPFPILSLSLIPSPFLPSP